MSSSIAWRRSSSCGAGRLTGCIVNKGFAGAGDALGVRHGLAARRAGSQGAAAVSFLDRFRRQRGQGNDADSELGGSRRGASRGTRRRDEWRRARRQRRAAAALAAVAREQCTRGGLDGRARARPSRLVLRELAGQSNACARPRPNLRPRTKRRARWRCDRSVASIRRHHLALHSKTSWARRQRSRRRLTFPKRGCGRPSRMRPNYGTRAARRQVSGGTSARAAAGGPGVRRGESQYCGRSDAAQAGTAGVAGGDLESLLRPSVTPAVSAKVLPTQRLLLPKGAFLDCTLETAIDSTLPGMTTCVLATDTFGADGTVVLLERGTKLVGETRGQVRAGLGARLRAVDRGAHTDRRRRAAGVSRHRRARPLGTAGQSRIVISSSASARRS